MNLVSSSKHDAVDAGKNAKPKMETAKVCLEDLLAALQNAETTYKQTGNDAEASQIQDQNLIRDKVKPLVQEEIRKEVDADMRTLLRSLKVSLLCITRQRVKGACITTDGYFVNNFLKLS